MCITTAAFTDIEVKITSTLLIENPLYTTYATPEPAGRNRLECKYKSTQIELVT